MRRTLRILIVDDDPLTRATIRTLVARDPGLETAGEAGDAASAAKAIDDLRPDLVFLDISMPRGGGFDALRAAGGDPPGIIFVTAFEPYAIEALRAGAIDYLLKPFTDEQFFASLDRARMRLGGRAASDRIVVKSGSRMTVLPAAEIGWIEAADNYVEIHTTARTHLVRQTMREMEGQLDARRFIRVHRSAIVNLDHVREIRGDPHGDGIAILSTGGTVRISRSRRDAVGRALEQQALSGGSK